MSESLGLKPVMMGRSASNARPTEFVRKMSKGRVNVDVVSSTIDEEERSIELVFTTGQEGVQWHPDIGEFVEKLEVTESAIRAERLDKGLSVIDSHQRWQGIDGVHGITTEYTIADGKIVGRAKFHTDDVWEKVRSGILPHFSLGYQVHEYRAIVDPNNKTLDTYVAVDWEPLELSIVPVSFETKNGVQRSLEPYDAKNVNDVKITGDTDMLFRNMGLKYGSRVQEPQNTDGGDGSGAPATPTQAEIDAAQATLRSAGVEPSVIITPNEPAAPSATEVAAAQALLARAQQPAQAPVQAPVVDGGQERAMLAGYIEAARSAGLNTEHATDAFSAGTSIDSYREQVLTALAERSAGNNPAPMLNGEAQSHNESVRQNVEAYLQYRANPEANPLAADSAARNYAGMTMMEIFREVNGAKGLAGLSRMAQAGRAFHSDSAFPLIFQNLMNKNLTAGYNEVGQTFRGLGNRATVNDFREKHTYKMGDAPDLRKLGQNGEYEQGTFGESKESYRIHTFARKIGISRQMLVNDDMSALSMIPRMWGNAGSRMESDVVWSLLTGIDYQTYKATKQKTSDGKTYFHADHKNLVSGALGTFGADAFSDLRLKGRKMKTIDDKFMNIVYNTLAIPPELEQQARLLLQTTINATTTGDAKHNLHKGEFDFVVEPRLSIAADGTDDATAMKTWFAFSNMINAFEYAYLAGQEGMATETVNSMDVDGVSMLVRQDFGAGYSDWRGAAKRVGQ